MNRLVSCEWLNDHLGDEDLVLLDASLKKTISGKESNIEGTIAGARYFDLKGKFSDLNSAFPNTLPSPEQFELECRNLGINANSKIVVFDDLGIYSSPRVWWMFKTMGHNQVFVLNGGLPTWINMKLPIDDSYSNEYQFGNFKARLNPQNIVLYQDLIDPEFPEEYLLIDARSKGRFDGIEQEPRPHLQSGHIPHSINIPYTSVLEEGKYKSLDELKDLFINSSLSHKKAVFSCGSGLTACIVMLAFNLAINDSLYLYDGSWTEWAERQNLKTS